MSRPALNFIPPMLPTFVEQPPEGNGWLHEIKYDGYRTQVVIDGCEARAYTRTGSDWSHLYEPIIRACKALRCGSAIIDGEVCVRGRDGITDYRGLTKAIVSAPDRLRLFAFDLLSLDGVDLRFKPLLDRRRMLEDLISPHASDGASTVQFSPHVIGDGRRLFKAADQAGLEGVVSKRVDSRYASVRAQSWLKSKSFTVGEYEVLGIERSSAGIPVALLGSIDGDTYVGDAMITLPAHERQAFWASINRLGTPRARLASLARRTQATWLEAGLVVRVRHLRGADKLRHATLQSL